MSLGQHASGESWQNTNIKGGVFAGSAVVQENTAFDSLASRRGMNLAVTATVGGQSFNGSPFAPGVRDNYLLTQGEFFPVSRASESGRAAFVPISRGELFFDRFAVDQNNTPLSAETNMLSDTGWNHYSMGSLQAAMRLDVVAVESETNATPAKLRFSYLMPDGTRAESYETLSGVPTNLPAGYVRIKNQNERHQFPVGAVVDVAYGTDGGFAFLYDISGEVAFDNQTFGNPKPGVAKYGYWRPRAPFRIKPGGGRTCVALYPERLPEFLAALKAAGPAVNHSVVVNVDYSITGLNDPRRKPSIPSTNLDYGVILQECANLTPFTKGFSLVTNFRLYMGDDFNVVEATPPVGYTPAGRYFPPCSLFAPERRYGVEEDPFEIKLSGQVGSLAKGHKINIGDGDIAVVRPLESRGVSNEELKAGRIVVNLRPITHPVELPPITMMNWLVVLEERRKEFFGGK